MRNYLGFWLLILWQAPAGAAPLGADSPLPEESCEAPWSLEYHISGGFLGMRQVIRITDDARMSVIDERRGREKTGLLSPPDIEALSRQVHAVYLTPQTFPAESACRDCINHELKLTVSGKVRNYHQQSGDALSSDMTVLLQQLSQYVLRD